MANAASDSTALNRPCSRRLFLAATASTFAGAVLAACGSGPREEVAAADVPVGSAIIVGDFIIAQPTAGEYKAYSTRCPHQKNRISKVEGDIVRCTAHNSKFSIVDGDVVDGPARTGMETADLKVKGDQLSVGN
ncbi:Rieske (2Fe-2S) protein [Corynebacterium uberis]|uniref:Rieske (2Fe-2S) protein n=1 Tax=Corynebacterium TaxID=1716 RepID=UPI001D0A167D|nr:MULTISPECIES: Rieske (2Fe-2S) protein [Corynebacterium]MCZ9310173.1 Rieske (2Fe-2S) protein [Corynebacterium sp. c6VSa_13]UDL73311.1 Rieske (2Fe-2S) protein [Corynebacterium uberis]UDL75811.1 Rieske (2Fe-2S) protein [Corynebacterium uberis]UDL78024.1 Rieske (2Fe-2S) protein [Corynebacterium uberis]UDL80306.1 Rieske (2Fe-2S) protein [Corynebacterium uberis]